MPEEKKHTTAESKPVVASPAPVLAPASESGDPAVHQILAERQTAAMNSDEGAIAAADSALAKLGFK